MNEDSQFGNPKLIGEQIISNVGLTKSLENGLGKIFNENNDLQDSLDNLTNHSNQSVNISDSHAHNVLNGGSLDSETPSGQMHPLHDIAFDHSLRPDLLNEHLSEKLGQGSSHAPMVTAAITKTIGDAVNYLDAKRPPLIKGAPMDMDPEATPTQIAEFNKHAEVVDNPKSVFSHIKDGSLMPQHIEALKTVYPNLYEQMQNSIMDKMIDYANQKDHSSLPYTTKIAISKFLGMPVESSLKPESILSNQTALSQIQAAKAQAESNQMSPSKSGMEKMKGLDGEQTRYQKTLNRKR